MNDIPFMFLHMKKKLSSRQVSKKFTKSLKQVSLNPFLLNTRNDDCMTVISIKHDG